MKKLIKLVFMCAIPFAGLASDKQYGPFGTDADVRMDQISPTMLEDVELTIYGEPMAVGDCVALYRLGDSSLCGLGEVVALKDGTPNLTISINVNAGTQIHFKAWRKATGETYDCDVSCNYTLSSVGSFISGIVLTVSKPKPILYVDANNGSDENPGRSLSTALASIQKAVDVAQDGYEIIVNDGYYRPISTLNKKIVIRSVNGWENTVIDASLQWTQGITNRCARLCGSELGTNTVLSGITLINGIALNDGIAGGGVLGGMLTNCVIAGCFAIEGGGAYGSTLTECGLYKNTAFEGGGAKMCDLSFCDLEENEAYLGGGTFACDATDCDYKTNSARMRLAYESTYSDGYGGGAYGGDGHIWRLTRCRFTENYAEDSGGAIAGSVNAVQCVLATNSASWHGGGSYDATLRNCLLVGNRAELYGGGAYHGTLNNCTVVGNEQTSSSAKGGGTYDATLANCIVWGNHGHSGDDDISIDGYVSASSRYCCSGSLADGIGNISADPCFLNPENGDYRLKDVSPCVNAGDNSIVVDAYDLNGLSRVFDGMVDIGAYECDEISVTWTVTFKPGTDGTGLQQTATKTNDVALTLKGEIFTRTGYSQTGWAISDGGIKVYELGDSYLDNSDITLYPFWSQKHTVAFDANGGIGNMSPQTFTNGVAQALVDNAFTYAGYTFNGWATNATDMVAYTNGQNVMVSSDMVLYARWELIPVLGPEFIVENGTLKSVELNGATSVTIPDGVLWIGEYAFKGCSNLVEVINLDRVEGIGVGAFMDCSSLTHISLPEGITAINRHTFYGCSSLDSVIIPQSVTSIGQHAFYGCSNLQTVDMPPFINDLGMCAFCGCTNLTSITIPAGVSEIKDSLFYGCEKLTNVVMNAEIENIRTYAFRDCRSLRNLVMPSSVSTMDGSRIFWGAENLLSLTFESNAPTANPGAFYGFPTSCVIYVSKDSTGWGVEIPGTWNGMRIEYYDLSTYTVTYEPGANGRGSQWTATKTNDVALTLKGEIFTRTGCSQTGWAISDGGTKVYGLGDFYLDNADITLYPFWSANLYTLTFDTDGGSAVAPITQEYGITVIRPAEPTKTGFTFMGWEPTLPATMPAENMTLKAQWQAIPPPPPVVWTVTFDANGGEIAELMRSVTNGYAVGELPVVERDGYDFDGWFTAASGGSRVSDNFVVMTNLTLYAHWSEVPPSEPEMPMLWPDADVDATGRVPPVACVYDGYLYNKVTGVLAGTIQVKVGKAKLDKKTQSLTAAVKATVIGLDGKKKSLKAAEKGKAAIESDGPTEIELVGGEACTVTLGAKGMSGTYGSYDIDGALNVFTSKDAADKATATAVLGKWQGAVNVAWRTDATGRVPPYLTMTVTIANKGKAKVAGTLADGTKVSASSQLLVGEEWCCVPVVVTKKAQMAFVLWLPKDATGRTDATGRVPPCVVGLGEDVKVGKPGALKGGAAFRIDVAVFAEAWGQAALPYLPDGIAVTVSGAKWTLPKAGKVVYVKGTTDVDESKAGENPSGLKLTYKAKDGTFKGSFKAYEDVNGKPKATTVNVTGVLIDGVGYGSATIKKVGGVPVTVE